MSNFETKHDKNETHLEELRRRHKELDDEVKMLYIRYADDETLNRKKTMKLWIKDEIHRLENGLKNKC